MQALAGADSFEGMSQLAPLASQFRAAVTHVGLEPLLELWAECARYATAAARAAEVAAALVAGGSLDGAALAELAEAEAQDLPEPPSPGTGLSSRRMRVAHLSRVRLGAVARAWHPAALHGS